MSNPRQTADIVTDLRNYASGTECDDQDAARVIRDAADRLEASAAPPTQINTDKLREALIAELTERCESAKQYAKEAHDGGYLWRASPWCFSPEEWADAVLERLGTAPAETFRPADKPIPPEVYHNKPGNDGIFTAEMIAASALKTYTVKWSGMSDDEIKAPDPQTAAIERMRCVYVREIDFERPGVEALITVSDDTTTNVYRVSLDWVPDGFGKWVASYSAEKQP